MSFRETLMADLRAPLARDPACRGLLDVVLSYPGFHAIVAYRLLHRLQQTGVPLLPRFLAHLARFFTGIEIHPAARLGKGFFIDHGMGVVIGETVEAGDDCTLYQGVTLGGTSLLGGKRHPTLGDRVTVGVGAAVLGAITVGDDAKVGAGSVVVRDVPARSTVVGIPARVVIADGKPVHAVVPPTQVDLPDPQAALVGELLERIAALERRVAELAEVQAGDDAAASL